MFEVSVTKRKNENRDKFLNRLLFFVSISHIVSRYDFGLGGAGYLGWLWPYLSLRTTRLALVFSARRWSGQMILHNQALLVLYFL